MMNDLPIWPIVITVSLIVGGYFALRNKTCSAIFFRIVAGVCLMALGGLLFLYPGLAMMGAFADTERKAGAQVVFTDTPIFFRQPRSLDRGRTGYDSCRRISHLQLPQTTGDKLMGVSVNELRCN